ncbi:hypothetical protein GCM10011613_28860 [Cellvibrio zantedeschiae]|uniref:BioF2-like acetyltransferase domain-containing protein n=1 Tax=Cellvibrio zantedeschiae TaxID=1237077 RepID=A0ABQ3B8F3_9GAMM|nr:FemAB family XrtA/PEP-CTERM system-associated protein [Cellvibrio zantedeschiae]GGY82322.1 hypothetical protein GCM10011613_28860 [Cellvibrio zantedeschiae]
MTQLTKQDELKTQLCNYKLELKIAKDAKAKVASQFKHLVVGSEEYSALLLSMQTVSNEVKEIEKKIKAIEKASIDQTLLSDIPDAIHPPLLTIPNDVNWADDFIVREIIPEEFPAWYDFISTIPNATAYHQQAWKELIEFSFQNTTRVWAAFDLKNAIIGGIPLTFFDSHLFGKFAVSIPYVNYGGVITRYFNIAQQLLAHLRFVCDSESLSHIEVRTMQPDLAEKSSSKKASMILRLPKTSEELEKDLGSKVRAQQKKAEDYLPTIKFGKLELLNDFYRVFSQNMRDLGTPVYSKKWFMAILKNSQVNATIAVVNIKGKPVSAAFLIGHNEMMEIPWASTIKEANIFNSNMWMYRKILDFAIHNKFSFFDFGRSTQDAGTYKFKKQWGAVPYQHYWYKILPNATNNEGPELNPDNPKFAIMIAVWKKLPLWLANTIGPAIIRNIP